MADSIENKVAKSSLILINLEDYITKGPRTLIDIAQWLEDGFLLREKPFRALIKEHNWVQYTNHHIALDCSSQAILPSWTNLLITSYLTPFASTIVLGDLDDLEKHLFTNTISELNLSSFQNKSLIIKGCSDSAIPKNAYVQLIQRLQTVAKSLFYGEACSSVPLWKANKKR